MEDFDRVLSLPKKDLWIGKRYIEIFKSTSEEMEYVLEKAERQANQPWDNVIRVKGLPFKVNIHDVITIIMPANLRDFPHFLIFESVSLWIINRK